MRMRMNSPAMEEEIARLERMWTREHRMERIKHVLGGFLILSVTLIFGAFFLPDTIGGFAFSTGVVLLAVIGVGAKIMESRGGE